MNSFELMVKGLNMGKLTTLPKTPELESSDKEMPSQEQIPCFKSDKRARLVKTAITYYQQANSIKVTGENTQQLCSHEWKQLSKEER